MSVHLPSNSEDPIIHFCVGSFFILMTLFILSQRQLVLIQKPWVQCTSHKHHSSSTEQHPRLCCWSDASGEGEKALRLAEFQTDSVVLRTDPELTTCRSTKNEFSVSSQIHKNVFKITFGHLNFFVGRVNHSRLRKRGSFSWDASDGKRGGFS